MRNLEGSMMIKFISKVGANRGRSRIWLEGARLAKAGFNWNVQYSTHFDNLSIKLVIDAEGDRKVAGRMRNNKEIPILDLCSAGITKFAKGYESVQVIVSNGVIVITRKEVNQ